MQYNEELLWILDKQGVRLKGDEEYRQNIDFVHSLGLKCDCVGWSRLNLSDPRTDEILAAIENFCKEAGWTARGLYTRTYTQIESDWYELVCEDIKENTEADWFDITSNRGDKLTLVNIRAYHEMRPAPKYWRELNLVPERFRNACMAHHISDAYFCWVRDKGKYAAEQYFFLYPAQRIPHIAVSRGFEKTDLDRVTAAGGYLPKIASIFSTLQQINLQNCYLKQDMPAGGIAYAYSPRTFTYWGRNSILVHKDVAELLIREKALSPNALRPAPIVDAVPGGYVLDSTEEKPQPQEDYAAQILPEYEQLKTSHRPVRMVSEKDALKMLRTAKRERKEDFQKALPKKQELASADERFMPLEPYYRISNGGNLSDEYSLLPFAQALEENKSFQQQLISEELLEDRPDGIVFAKCPDGDCILLCTDGTVIRFSHEAPEVLDQWPSLAQFLFDAVSEGN